MTLDFLVDGSHAQGLQVLFPHIFVNFVNPQTRFDEISQVFPHTHNNTWLPTFLHDETLLVLPGTPEDLAELSARRERWNNSPDAFCAHSFSHCAFYLN